MTDGSPHADVTGPDWTSTSVHRLDRYRPVIEEWEAFLEANHTPEPVTLRARRPLIEPGDLTRRLAARGFQVVPVAGMEGFLRILDGPDSVAQTLEHWMGLFHIQQAVMGLPSLALAPEPGERILDLCAAPGGKTTHLSELMEERGALVAVDPKEKRLRGLMANVFRLGCTNVLVIAADGRELPGQDLFDRVLVDVPCSAEGNYRRQEGTLPPRSPGFQDYVTSLQDSLLRRAVELTRPGGVVVYSTCTFAPEENEAVVDRALRELPVQIEPIELPVPHAPGLVEWEDTRFSPSLASAWRVYPHDLDSGGLFMARLRKLDSGGAETRRSRTSAAPPDAWTPIPVVFPGEDPDPARNRVSHAVDLLRGEYGFDPHRLPELGWLVRKENIWVQTAAEWPVEGWSRQGGWRVVSLGLRAFRSAGPGKETPSNHFLSRFRSALWSSNQGKPTRRRELERDELRRLLSGEAVVAEGLPAGPIVLYHQGSLLGRGMVGRGGLRSEIPLHQAERLRAVMAATGT